MAGSDYNGNNIGLIPKPKPVPEAILYIILLGASAAPVPQLNIYGISFGSKPEPEPKEIPTTTHSQQII